MGTVDTDSISDVGKYFNSPDAPLPIVTYVSTKFVEAEAALRAGNAARAQTAYNAAIAAHLNKVGVAAADRTPYLTANGTVDANATTALRQIMTQKYIANFLQIEAWSDYRRTRLPPLIPNPDGVIKVIPERLPTPQGERINNRNATVVADLTKPVYWTQ